MARAARDRGIEDAPALAELDQDDDLALEPAPQGVGGIEQLFREPPERLAQRVRGEPLRRARLRDAQVEALAERRRGRLGAAGRGGGASGFGFGVFATWSFSAMRRRSRDRIGSSSGFACGGSSVFLSTSGGAGGLAGAGSIRVARSVTASARAGAGRSRIGPSRTKTIACSASETTSAWGSALRGRGFTRRTRPPP
ncbi:MAG: hypothetical protein U1F45_02740 [Burkholderiales bacterium]